MKSLIAALSIAISILSCPLVMAEDSWILTHKLYAPIDSVSAVSSDGSRITTLYPFLIYKRPSRGWAQGSPEYVRCEDVHQAPASLVGSDDGSILAYVSMGHEGFISIASGITGKRLASLRMPPIDYDDPTVDISGDGSTIVLHERVGLKEGVGTELYVYQRPAGGWSDMDEPAAVISHGDESLGQRVSINYDGSIIAALNDCRSATEIILYMRSDKGWTSGGNPTYTNVRLSPVNYFFDEVSMSSDGSTIALLAEWVGPTNIGNRLVVYQRPEGGWKSSSQAPVEMVLPGFQYIDHYLAVNSDGTIVVGSTDSRATRIYMRPPEGWAEGVSNYFVTDKSHHVSISADGTTVVINGQYVYESGWPTVTTAAPTATSRTTASAGGNVTSQGRTPVFARGVCWSTQENPTLKNSKTEDGSDTGLFTSAITGLTETTTYHVRAYASNLHGTSYGHDMTFTTPHPDLPRVTTAIPFATSHTTAGAGGSVTDEGQEEVIARGVCWSTSSNPTIDDSLTEDGSGNGEFSSQLTGLTPGTSYYLRAYATNAGGTAYGEEQTFATPTSGRPTVVTTVPTEVAQTTAQSGGNVTDQGESDVIMRGVCWSTAQYPTYLDQGTMNGHGPGAYTSDITGLKPLTKYWVRAFATNSQGTSYGQQYQITTQK